MATIVGMVYWPEDNPQGAYEILQYQSDVVPRIGESVVFSDDQDGDVEHVVSLQVTEVEHMVDDLDEHGQPVIVISGELDETAEKTRKRLQEMAEKIEGISQRVE